MSDWKWGDQFGADDDDDNEEEGGFQPVIQTKSMTRGCGAKMPQNSMTLL